jgi:hypothetical protein
MPSQLTVRDQVFYDEGWFLGHTGLEVGDGWKLMPEPWRQGFTDAIERRLSNPWPTFSVVVYRQSQAAVNQAVLRYLWEPAVGPPHDELNPDDQTDGGLLDAMRSKAVPVTDSGSVLAHIEDHPNELVVRTVLAGEPRTPGDVGRWLDSLPRQHRVVVPAVVSARLYGMLQRRGFNQQHWWDDRLGIFDHGAMIRVPEL